MRKRLEIYTNAILGSAIALAAAAALGRSHELGPESKINAAFFFCDEGVRYFDSCGGCVTRFPTNVVAYLVRPAKPVHQRVDR